MYTYVLHEHVYTDCVPGAIKLLSIKVCCQEHAVIILIHCHLHLNNSLLPCYHLQLCVYDMNMLFCTFSHVYFIILVSFCCRFVKAEPTKNVEVLESYNKGCVILFPFHVCMAVGFCLVCCSLPHHDIVICMFHLFHFQYDNQTIASFSLGFRF